MIKVSSSNIMSGESLKKPNTQVKLKNVTVKKQSADESSHNAISLSDNAKWKKPINDYLNAAQSNLLEQAFSRLDKKCLEQYDNPLKELGLEFLEEPQSDENDDDINAQAEKDVEQEKLNAKQEQTGRTDELQQDQAGEDEAIEGGTGEDEEKSKSNSKAPEDKSGALMRRLVAASHRLEIGEVVAEAFKEIIQLRMALASDDDSQKAAIKRILKKMEKVVTRSFKKNQELGKEESLRLEHARAKREEDEQRADSIDNKLKKHIKDRRERERKYLYEDEQNKSYSVNMPSGSGSISIDGISTEGVGIDGLSVDGLSIEIAN